MAWSDLWRLDGRVGRGKYLLLGASLFALKHNLDRVVATMVFHRPWSVFNYAAPGLDALRPALLRGDSAFYATLVALALPFVWTGIALTLRRLRDALLPAWLVLLFFAPFANLLFFLVLSVLPSRPEDPDLATRLVDSRLGRFIPDNPVGSAAVALLLIVPPAAAAAALCASFLRTYGWGLFVGLPFASGLGSVLLYGYHRPRDLGSCLGVACLSVGLLGAVLFAVAIEGIFCIAMAAPLGLALGALGGLVGYTLQKRPWLPGEAPLLLGLLLLSLPGMMGAEWAAKPPPPVFPVRTSVDVDAAPEKVWRHVVSFSELPPPEEFLFRRGIAYPVRAEIQGRGPGAVRRCVFSTGAFVEPIEVWDEPRLLKFSVTAQPASMQEWSPYPGLNPPHLNDFLVSSGGQFLLTPLPGGRTRLEGTTWYRHSMWPAAYWKLWSDAVIHRIHLRVLNHVKRLSEGA